MFQYLFPGIPKRDFGIRAAWFQTVTKRWCTGTAGVPRRDRGFGINECPPTVLPASLIQIHVLIVRLGPLSVFYSFIPLPFRTSAGPPVAEPVLSAIGLLSHPPPVPDPG